MSRSRFGHTRSIMDPLHDVAQSVPVKQKARPVARTAGTVPPASFLHDFEPRHDVPDTVFDPARKTAARGLAWSDGVASSVPEAVEVESYGCLAAPKAPAMPFLRNVPPASPCLGPVNIPTR